MDIPLVVIFEAINPNNPKYSSRMRASIKGDKACPKYIERLEIVETLTSVVM